MRRAALASLIVVSIFLFFPETTESFYTLTELSYKPRNARGIHGLGQYLGGVSQINLVNGNLTFGRSLQQRPGRAGFAPGLNIFYNSKLWDRQGTDMVITELGSTYGVGLGWRLAYPMLVTGNSTYAVVMPDGSSHEIVYHGGGDWRSVDSSYIRLDPVALTATLPGGTKLTFGQTVGSNHFMTLMTDRNGNEIQVQYVPGTGKIDRIHDTLKLLCIFHYDTEGFLEKIETYGQPAFDIWFTYEDANLNPTFTQPHQAPTGEKLLTEIMFLPNGNSLEVKQVFFHNNFGEITKIDNQVQKYVFQCSGGCQWVPDGPPTVRTLETYTYETREFYDATYSSVEERLVKKQTRKIHNMGLTLSRDFTITYTSNSIDSNPSHVKVADIKGNTHHDFHYTSNGRDWTDGLVTKVERKFGGVVYNTQDTVWTQDTPTSTVLENPRVSSQTNTLENGLSTSVDYTYLTDGTGNVEEVTENDFNGDPIRKTIYTYLHETNPAYDTYHLTSLMETIEVQDDLGAQLSKSTFGYDETPLADYPSIGYHDPSYDTNFTTRGNQTSASQYFSEESRWITSHSEYDIAGNVVKTIDPMGRESTFSFYSNWDYTLLESASNHLGHTINYDWVGSFKRIDRVWQWVTAGQVKDITDPNGIVVQQNVYNGYSALSQRTTPLDTTNYSFSVVTYLSTVSSAPGYHYGTHGTGAIIERQQTDPTGENIVASQEQNTVGDITWKPPHRYGTSGASGSQTYDALGRVTTVNPPGAGAYGGSSSYTYDGNEVTVLHAGHDKRYTYNEGGQVVSIMEEDDTGALTLETTYDYDELGRMTETTQGVQTRTFVYDSLGRLTSETHPENGTTTFTYYDDGQLKTSTDARAVVTTLTYDALGRPATKTFSDGTPSVTFNHDETTTTEIPTITNSVGRMTSAWTSDNIGYTWSYDEVGRKVEHVASIDGTDYPASYDYVDDGGCGCSTKDLLQIVYPNNFTIDYTRDSIGRPTSVTSPLFQGSAVTYVDSVLYDSPSGAPSMIGIGGGAHSSYSYASSGHLTSILIGSTQWPHVDWDYSYTNGRISQIFEQDRTTQTAATWKRFTYSYDELHRLETAKREDSDDYGANWDVEWDSTYSYDRYNNMTQHARTGVSPNTWNFTVDTTKNWTTARNTKTFSYNVAGQMITDTKQVSTYGWDGAGRLKDVTHSTTGANKGTYRYDAFGRRVKKVWGTASDEIIYVYGAKGELLLEEQDVGGYFTSVYHVQMAGKLVAKRTIGQEPGFGAVDKVKYMARNHLDEIRVTTEVNLLCSGPGCTSPLQKQSYAEPFYSQEDDQFQGHEFDGETGLQHMGARFYHPEIRRWMSPDPARQLISMDMNRYTFARNDAVSYVDPDGRRAVSRVAYLGQQNDPPRNPPLDLPRQVTIRVPVYAHLPDDIDWFVGPQRFLGASGTWKYRFWKLMQEEDNKCTKAIKEKFPNWAETLGNTLIVPTDAYSWALGQTLGNLATFDLSPNFSPFDPDQTVLSYITGVLDQDPSVLASVPGRAIEVLGGAGTVISSAPMIILMPRFINAPERVQNTLFYHEFGHVLLGTEIVPGPALGGTNPHQLIADLFGITVDPMPDGWSRGADAWIAEKVNQWIDKECN